MASPGDSQLQEQMRADPRIRAIVDQRRTGALSAVELRAFGYDVPEGYHYTFGGRAGYGTLMDDKRSFAEKAAPIGAIAAGAVAGLGATGAIPGIAGVGGGARVGNVNGVIDKAIGGISPGDVSTKLGGGILDYFKDPKNLLNLAPIIGALAANRGGGGNLNGGMGDDFLKNAYEDSKKRQAMIDTRYQRVDPLHQAITQLAMNRLPDSVRKV